MRLAPGTRLGAYEIVAPLGAGGMGEVYRARDSRLGREVAVKVLPADVANEPERLARLEREARTVATLNHPNIVTLHSIEEAGGVRFITLELVEGESLDRHVAPGGLPLARVLEIAVPLADALAAAHERMVVHRDLKPANVMLTREGRVKVLDFGLAKPLSTHAPEASQGVTVTSPPSGAGEVVGTVAYMSPEQLRGRNVDARTDLFAFGIVLYELLTGRRPFQGDSSAELSSSILHDVPPPIETVRGDLPRDMARLIARCLEKDPERRVQTAKDVRNELEWIRRALESGTRAAHAGSDASQAPDPSTVAVLPFANRGRDADDEYFADGITEDVIAHLCKARTLKVISRASVMAFKDAEARLQEVAARLRVAHVLTGSVRRAGDRVRIVAQLVDAGSGRTLWAETYDRHLTDIFSVQTDVALHIAAALKAELSPEERQRIHREPTRDLQAYEHYLRGRQSLVRFTSEGMLEAIGHFERAIERDPGFAMGYVGLAMAHTELGETGRLSRDQAGHRAIAAAAKAVALDPELGEAHCARAHARMAYEFDWVGAEAAFKRAIELSPGHSDAYDLYGRLCSNLGRFDEAIALQERAFELDPLTHRTDIATSLLRAGRLEEAARAARRSMSLAPDDARPHATLGWILFHQGRVDEGIAELERAVAMMPGEDIWVAQLAQVYALAGRTDRARELLRRLEDPARPEPASPYHLAYVHTGLGEADLAMDCLERAYASGVGGMLGLKGSFLFAPLRGHPRFTALLERMKLA